MSAPLKGFQLRSGDFRKSLASRIRHMRIVFGVEEHYLRRGDFHSMMPGAVEGAAAELLPVCVGKAVAVAERFANIFGVVFIGGFRLFGTIQNSPVDHGAICDHALNPRIEGGKDGCRASEASSDDEDLIRREAEVPTEGNFFNCSWETRR